MSKIILSLLAVFVVVPAYAKPTVQVKRSPRAATANVAKGKNVIKSIKLSCTVAGSPVEFPNDLMIKNEGLGIVKKGMILTWATKGEKGKHVVTENLEPSKTLRLNDVLKRSLEAGTKCSIKLQSRAKRPNPRVFRK